MNQHKDNNQWDPRDYPYIRRMTPEYEKTIRQIPLLNIDSTLIPSPYILDRAIDIDYDHSLVWYEKGELLGYLLVYATPDRKKFHIFREVTSPFARGKGIGTAMVRYLAHNVHLDSHIYILVWEKLTNSIEFFTSKGFKSQELIVYRKMKYLLMSATARTLRETAVSSKKADATAVEELTRVRHDVKKSVKVLFDMASMLSVDNFNRVAEDINRETRALLNTLNMYEDTIHLSHKVSLKELITERVIPFVEAVDSSCEVRLVLRTKITPVNGSYTRCSRALINLVSNALDAIRDAGRRGVIEFVLEQRDDTVTLSVSDNGTGIAPQRLERGTDGVPVFVGHSTKGTEGVGTRQIFSTFGAENIEVESRVGEFTRWSIALKVSNSTEKMLLADLRSRYFRFIKLTQKIPLVKNSTRNDVAIFIWQLRQMELFCFDLIYQFSKYNNIRDIFHNVLLYRFGGRSFDFLKEEMKKFRIDHPVIRSWLLGIAKRISRNETFLSKRVRFDDYKDELFQSYGQALGRTMIFTMDPDTGMFFTVDRKLAEHLDFVPYLKRDKDELLRGELIGDVRNVSSPIYLGVWTVTSLDDLHEKLKMIRKGAQRLLEMGLDKEKRMAFYNTTYNTCDCELDTYQTLTIGEMAELKEEEFDRYVRQADNEMSGLVFST